MEVEDFIKFCEDVRSTNPNTIDIEKKILFSSIAIGYDSNYVPPSDDDVAQRGYKIGKELRKNK